MNDKPVETRDYQRQAIQKLEDEREKDNNAGLLKMATGTGKTLTAAFDVENFNPEKVLFLAHRQEIIEQARLEFQKVFGAKKEMGLLYGKKKQKEPEFLFSTVQTISKNRTLKEFDPEEFDYIIVDEFHHSLAPTYQKVLDHFKPEFLLGLTATPFLIDVDEEDLLEYLELENPTFEYGTDEATSNGDLSEFEAYIYKDNIDYGEAPGELSEKDLNKKLFMPERDQFIAQKWKEEASDRKTIAFCRSIEHAERTAEHFEQQGIKAETVHSEMPGRKRDKLVKKFREGEIEVLTGVDVFNEGVDFPQVECLIFMRPTMSKRIFHQQLGRGLRKIDGKDKCLVLDFVNETDWNRLNWYGISQSKTEYKSGKCESCGRESSELLEVEEGEKVCKDCRTDDFEIFTGMGEVYADVEALFDIADEYQSYRFNTEGYSKEELLKKLSELYKERGEVPHQEDFNKIKYLPSWQTYTRKFGSMRDAVDALDIDYEFESRRGSKVKKEHIKEDIISINKEFSGMLTRNAYRNLGSHSLSTVFTKFSTENSDAGWKKILSDLGIVKSREFEKNLAKEISENQKYSRNFSKTDIETLIELQKGEEIIQEIDVDFVQSKAQSYHKLRVDKDTNEEDPSNDVDEDVKGFSTGAVAKNLIDAKEAANLTDKTARTLKRMANKGDLQAVKIENKWFFNKANILEEFEE